MVDRPEPILSVLVPAYNCAAYVADAISSVLDQSTPKVEIVVVDDGSTDDTAKVLRPWAEEGVLRYLHQRNRGPSAARNVAMANARGRLLMFLDADDLLLPGCIEATLGFLERYPEVGLFFANYDIFDDGGRVSASGVDTWKMFRSIPHRELRPGEWIFSESLTAYIIRHGTFMSTSGLTVRREVAERAGPFREGYSYAEDDEFYARAARICGAGYLDRVLSRVRRHTGSLIHSTAHRVRNTKHLLELTEIQLEDYGDDPHLQRILRRKARTCAAAYGWNLIEERRLDEAVATLRTYLARHPLHWPLYRLLAKATLLRALSRRP